MCESLRILHANSEKHWRGGEQLLLDLLQGLKERGHYVHLIARPDGELYRRAKRVGIPTFRVPMRGEWDVGAVWHMARILQRGHYHLLHAHTPRSHTLLGLARLWGARHLPLVVTKRTSFSIYRHSFLGLNWMKYAYLCDAVVTISQHVAHVLQKDGVSEEKIHLVYDAVREGRFRREDPTGLQEEFGLPADSLKVGVVAHFSHEKGQLDLLEALPQVLQAFPKAYFFFLGEGELLAQAKERSRELGIGEHVFFTGFRKDVGRFLKWWDLLVVPSRMEGLGSTILDAFMCHLPVVATAVGGIPEVVRPGQTGLLARGGDPEDLARKICEALDQLPRMREMARKGRQMVLTHFTTDRMVEGVLQVYQKLLQQKS